MRENHQMFEIVHLDCDCLHPTHTMRYMYDEDENDLYVEMQLHQYRNVFERIWMAIKYVCNKSAPYGYWDCFLMNTHEAKKLHKILEKMIEKESKKQEKPV